MSINHKPPRNLTLSPKALFISDIHLDPQATERTTLFLDFLAFAAKNSTSLYILGDLFEYWIGDDDTSTFSQSIINGLKAYSDQHPLYIMHGNRDFMLGKRFMQQTGAIWLKDPTPVTYTNQFGLLMHGDLLCTLDKSYQCLRWWFSKLWVRRILSTLPLSWRRHIASRMRQKSQQYFHKNSTDHARFDTYQPTVEQYMKKYGASLLIHGHTHKAACHAFTLPTSTPCQRWVLGDWYKDGNCLLLNENNSLQYYPFESIAILADDLSNTG